MIRPARGLAILLSGTALCACAGPMGQQEAQARARHALAEYCADAAPCGQVRLTQTQRIASRWLVAFDSPARRYDVVLDNGGNARVNAWDKSPER